MIASQEPILSIIMLTSSVSSPHTRKAVEEIERNTEASYELFVYRDLKENFSFSKDNNKLIRICRGKFIVLINDDVFVGPGWDRKLTEVLDTDTLCGMAGAKLRLPDGFLYVGGRTKVVRGYLEIENNPFHRPYTDIILFALVAIKREVFERVGLLDEVYRLGFEDFDYCLRLKRAGYRIAVPDVTAFHLEGTSTGKLSVQFRLIRSAIIFYRRLRWPLSRILFKGFIFFNYYRLRMFHKKYNCRKTEAALKIYVKLFSFAKKI